MLLLKSTYCTLQYFPKFQLHVALAKSTVAYRTSPSKQPHCYSISPDRRSKSPSPTPKYHELPCKRLRLRSPPRQGRHQRDASSCKTGNCEEGSFFSQKHRVMPLRSLCSMPRAKRSQFLNLQLLKTLGWQKRVGTENEQGQLATPEGLVLATPKIMYQHHSLQKTHMCQLQRIQPWSTEMPSCRKGLKIMSRVQNFQS